MAFDFPNSPSVGQRVTGVGGIVYVWDGVKWASNIGSVTAQSMGDVGRNLLHNPLFNVAQRGGGPFTANGYTLDRWTQFFSGAGATVSTASLAASDTHRAQIGDEACEHIFWNTFTGTSGATDATMLQQIIEGVRRLGGKTVTISFWAASSAALRIGVSIDQAFGSGGSPSAAVLNAGQTITTATTFARYSLTFTLPSVAGKTLGTAGDATTLNFWFSAGSSNATRSGSVGAQSGAIYLWGVQLEIGSIATPLEKPDPRYDLSNSQRFYCFGNSYGFAYSAGTATVHSSHSLPVTMRASPTLLIQGTPSYSNASSLSFTTVDQTNFITSFTCSAAGLCQVGFSYQASADL